MRATRYKIAVFSDLKSESEAVLKNGLGLAEMIQGDVEVFHVINSTHAVKSDNQFSALRSMKDEFAASEKKVQRMIDRLRSRYSTKVEYRLGLGNVKNEIQSYLQEHKPEIVVLGRRKSNPFDFIGDGLTQWILNEHSGLVMIAPERETLQPHSDLSLGVLNGTEPSMTVKVFEELLEYVKGPIKSFSFAGGTSHTNTTEEIHNKKVVRYVFERGGDTYTNISNYLSKNNINLLWLERGSKTSVSKPEFPSKEVTRVIEKINIPLLLAGNRSYTKQPS